MKYSYTKLKTVIPIADRNRDVESYRLYLVTKNPTSDPNPCTRPETRTAAPKNEPYNISANAPKISPSVALPGF